MLDAWSSTLATLRAPAAPTIDWPADRVRRFGLSFPADPHAFCDEQILEQLRESPRSSTAIAARLRVPSDLVIRRLNRLRDAGDVVVTAGKLWSVVD